MTIEAVNKSIAAYLDEPSSMADLDRLVDESEMFSSVYKEVCGYVVQPRMNTEAGQGVRIDRILVPSKRIIDMGWTHGPIGVEGKTSGKKIGKVVSQAMDYHASVFEIKDGFHVMLEWIYLWPYSDIRGDIASVMVQNRIGMACSTSYAPLTFKTDSHAMLQWTGDTVQVKASKAGMKRGSR